MRFVTTLIAVSDMEKSKKFYHDVLGLDVIADFGANVTLTRNISLQTLDTWKDFIHKDKKEIIFKNNATELYFEEDNMDEFIKKLDTFENIEYVHRLFEHNWGQRVVRFYDLDKHIIEVGENMSAVAKRFLNSGLSKEEIAMRMDVAVEYVEQWLK